MLHPHRVALNPFYRSFEESNVWGVQRREIVAAVDSVHIISTTAITQAATCETLESGQPATRKIDLAPAGR